MRCNDQHKFGGEWTVQKLNILSRYMQPYTIMFKNLSLKTIYIDAFAGNGKITCKIEADEYAEIDGSVKLALDTSPPFNKYYFIEKNLSFTKSLLEYKDQYSHLDINIINEDCNNYLINLCTNIDWKCNRAVLFLDPYAMEVDWSTIQIIADTKAIDLWYLFPLSAVQRLMPKNACILPSHSHKLDRIFGDHSWYERFYSESRQLNLFEETPMEKSANTEMIKDYICERLSSAFSYVSDCPRILYNSKNSPLFIFNFAISNPSTKAINLAKKLSNHILKQ